MKTFRTFFSKTKFDRKTTNTETIANILLDSNPGTGEHKGRKIENDNTFCSLIQMN